MTEFVSTASCQQTATLQTRHCADSRSRIHFHHRHVQYGVHCPTSGWPCFSPRYVPPDSPSPAFCRPLSHLFPHRHPSPALCLTSLSPWACFPCPLSHSISSSSSFSYPLSHSSFFTMLLLPFLTVLSSPSFSFPLSHISFLTANLLLPSVSQFFPHHPSPALCLTVISSPSFSCPLSHSSFFTILHLPFARSLVGVLFDTELGEWARRVRETVMIDHETDWRVRWTGRRVQWTDWRVHRTVYRVH